MRVAPAAQSYYNVKKCAFEAAADSDTIKPEGKRHNAARLPIALGAAYLPDEALGSLCPRREQFVK